MRDRLEKNSDAGALETAGRSESSAESLRREPIIQPSEALDIPVRATRSERETNEWALVLAAEGIEVCVDAVDGAFVLLVAERDVPRARTALDAYDEESARDARTRGLPAPDALVAEWRTRVADDDLPAASLGVSWGMAVGAALLLIGFFAVTGSPADGARWFDPGAASAGRIVGGEPWRAVTALTLHVDAVHVASNALAVAVLLQALITRLGPGAGLLLMLLSGAGGNVLAAMVHDPRHVAVGASTATFGAIGALAALRALSSFRHTRSRLWIVTGASVVLLAMLGTAPGSDVLGHALGLVTGAALGFVGGAGRRALRSSVAIALADAAGVKRWRRGAVQWALVAIAVLVVTGCWHLALTAR
jgi:membrane associated rhomboid family serine protease